MGHISHNPRKVLSRVRRIGGQVTALETALQGKPDCAQVLIQIAAIRGAVHGLMMEVLGEHMQTHVVAEADATRRATEMAAITKLMRTYLK